MEQREERRERLSGAAEVEDGDGLVDGADHLPDSGGGVESGRLGSGEVGSSGSGTFVGNIAIQDSFMTADTSEVRVVVHPVPVAEGAQGGNRRSCYQPRHRLTVLMLMVLMGYIYNCTSLDGTIIAPLSILSLSIS